MDHPTLPDLPRLDEMELSAHTDVLLGNSRVDQSRIRSAVDAVFATHPTLGTVFEPTFDHWTSRPGGGWGWAVEPPAAAVADVIARQRNAFDMRTGRLFAVSLLPGDPDLLVLTASHLCIDFGSWQLVVDDLVTAYNGLLKPEGPDAELALSGRTSVPA